MRSSRRFLGRRETSGCRLSLQRVKRASCPTPGAGGVQSQLHLRLGGSRCTTASDRKSRRAGRESCFPCLGVKGDDLCSELFTGPSVKLLAVNNKLLQCKHLFYHWSGRSFHTQLSDAELHKVQPPHGSGSTRTVQLCSLFYGCEKVT